MDNVTQSQLDQCREDGTLSASTCDEIADGTLECLSAEHAMEMLEDNEKLYDLYNFISVNFG